MDPSEAETINWKQAVSDELQHIGQALQKAGGRPILVGGWVRDRLLKLPSGTDYDVEVFGMSAKKLHRLLKTFGPVYPVGKRFGILKMTGKQGDYDFSLPRCEGSTGPGHKNFWIDFNPHMSYQQAASRRDFTINSMGYAFLEDKLLDPFQGQSHLKKQLLQHIGPAFAEDSLRVLRAMQLAARLQFLIAPDTLTICQQQNLHELPQERIWEEWKKLLLSPQPSHGLRWAPKLGICQALPPLQQLHQNSKAWERTLSSLDSLAQILPQLHTNQKLSLMITCLCLHMDAHPSPTPIPRTPDNLPNARSTLQYLLKEKSISQEILQLLQDALTPQWIHSQQIQDPAIKSPGIKIPAAIRRLSLRTNIQLLHTLLTATAAPPLPQWLKTQAQQYQVWQQPPTPLIQGKHLLSQGMKPGIQLGKSLELAFQAQLDGRFSTLQAGLHWLQQQPQQTTSDE